MESLDRHGRLGAWAEKRLTKRGLRTRNAAYLIITIWVVFIVIFAVLEHLLDSKTFGTVWDGMWWGTQTVTTVGYGDITPHDTIGKVIGVILMLGGLSLIAVFTAIITSAFISQAAAERAEQGDDPVLQELQQLKDEVGELKAVVARSNSRR